MYKQSNYNYFVSYHQSQIVYYNALTRNVFVVSKKEHECLQSHFIDPISFELGYPRVFAQLVESGFFVKQEYDERAVLRYNYNKEILFCPELHIILYASSDMKIMEEYVETIKRHINFLMSEHHFTLICIEWLGEGILDIYDKIIIPLSRFIKKTCKQNRIPFRLQATIEIDKGVHSYFYYKKEYLNYQTIIRQIENICNSCPELTILVNIKLYPDSSNEISEYKKKGSTLDRLLIQWLPPKYQLKGENHIHTNFYLDHKNIIDKRWYSLKAPRLHQYIIMNNGDIYSGRQSINSVIIGKLSNDGIIEWKEQQRIQLLGTPWFEDEKCRKCKHLFLLSSICSHMNKMERKSCTLNLDTIIPEQIIIKEFDQKYMNT